MVATTALPLLLDKSEELVGCRFSVEHGPECELDFGDYRGTLELQSEVKPSQFQLMQLCTFDRAFRNLAINPVAIALMRHLIDPFATRFSSSDSYCGRTGRHRIARSSRQRFRLWQDWASPDSPGLTGVVGQLEQAFIAFPDAEFYARML